MRFLGLTGRVFGRLTVLSLVGMSRCGARYRVRCTCGQTFEVRGTSLTNGNTRSCGCLHIDTITGNTYGRTHGHADGLRSPTYMTWTSMRARCKNRPEYANVKICKRWLKFENFLKDMGERPDDTTLGRFGDIGDYKPSNCAWQTREDHEREKRRKARQCSKTKRESLNS